MDPRAGVQTTFTPERSFPNASVALTTSGAGSAVPAVADWLFPLTSLNTATGPVVAVAVNVVLSRTKLLVSIATALVLPQRGAHGPRRGHHSVAV